MEKKATEDLITDKNSLVYRIVFFSFLGRKKKLIKSILLLLQLLYLKCGPGSSVGIATGYGMDGPGIKSRWGRDFPHLSRPALGPTQPHVQWVPGLSRGVKSGRVVTLTPHPLLVPLVMKE